MNVHFVDKLSATVFHNMAREEQNQEFFQSWLLNKLLGAWCDRESDFTNGPRAPSGTLGTLHIAVNPKDVTGTSTYLLTTNNFDWWVTEQRVDTYCGQPDPDHLPKLLMVGGLYNSGTLNDPHWGSHT